MTVNIIDELDTALARTGFTKSLLAESLHLTRGAVTNWAAQGSIPRDKLPVVAEVLDDYDFRLAAAEYTYGVRIHSEAHVVNTPQARYFSQAKEENDRKALDPEFTVLLGKPKEDRTKIDRRRVLAYLKELDEEIEEKNTYAAAIMSDWGLESKEVS